MLEFAQHDHDVIALGVSWPHWSQRHLPLDRLVLSGGEAVNGIETPVRVAGVWTEPTASVLSLRTFDDAREGIIMGSPFVHFEMEKLLRMALRQDVFAFEILASHAVLHEVLPFDRREILRQTVCEELVHNLAKEALWRSWSTLRGENLRAAAALLCSAIALSRGVVTLHVPTVFTLLNLDLPADDATWRAHENTLRNAVERGNLAATPPGEELLNDWLVERRLKVSS